MEKKIYDSMIIGSGPAGLTAAIYNARAGLKTAVVGGSQPGGQLMITTVVENWPGAAQGIGGPKLMMEMQEQVKRLGGEIFYDIVIRIGKEGEGNVLSVQTESGRRLRARAIIVATGAKARWLGLEKEKELIGKGVSGCATCDGPFFRDKIVAVVGGGDTAVQEAIFLSRIAKKVYLIHRRNELRANKAEQAKLRKGMVKIIWDSEVIELNPKAEGQKSKLENIKIKNNKKGEERILEVEGLFVAIGADPATDFLKETVELDEKGYIKTGRNELYPSMTSVKGIFAAGDCVDFKYKQAITAAGDGCKAAIDAERWLEQKAVSRPNA